MTFKVQEQIIYKAYSQSITIKHEYKSYNDILKEYVALTNLLRVVIFIVLKYFILDKPRELGYPIGTGALVSQKHY